MSKKAIKPVRVELGGKERLLRFDFNAMTDFEDVMGFSLFTAVQGGQIGFKTMRAFYWAGLRWKEKGLTLPKTGSLLQEAIDDGEDFMSLMEPINEALEASGVIPTDDEEEEGYDEEEADEEDEGKNA